MDSWNGAAWIQRARELTRGDDTRKLAAIHAGIAAGAALLITLVQLVLEEGIAKTSGLSGLGMRSVLQTVGTLLQTANSVATPFWDLGFLFAALLWVRQRHAHPGDLLMGFRRFGAYLRLLFTEGVLLFFGGMFCAYASSFLYMMTPWAQPVMELAQSAGMDMNAANEMIAQMDLAAMDTLLAAMIPMLVIWGILCLAVLLPILYRFRMANFLILEERKIGGLAAMLLSAQMMRKRRWKLFLLDLRLWWYYGLQAVCFALYLSDLWLPLLGVTLPFPSEVTSMVLYVVYLLVLFMVRTLLRPQVDAAYALAYEYLRQAEPIMPKMRKAPENLPWDEP